MGFVTVNIQDWAAENFGTCQLGDARRTRRAVQVAQQRCDWVIRAAQLHRTVWISDERRMSLQDAIDEQPVLGTYEREVPAAPGRPRRILNAQTRR